jgi:hypothetical protein
VNGKLLPLRRNKATRGIYRAYQCGLCHHIGPGYGFRYRLFAGPDLVFYNLFLDVCASLTAKVEHRACVLAPMVSRLPSAVATERSELAAAVGIWFGSLKLQDDWNDEGGLHRWLGWKAFSGGAARARALLLERGFPVEAIESWMRVQAVLERSPAASYAEAAVPTVEIARLTFGFAGQDEGAIGKDSAGEIGAEIGRFLYHLDNLADFREDVDEGQYNALVRAFGTEDGHLPQAAREAAVEGAKDAIARLRTLLGGLPFAPEAQYLRETLVVGFSERLARHANAPDGHARELSPARKQMVHVYTAIYAEMSARPALRQLLRPQVAWVVMLVAAVVSRTAWAAKWWPEEATPQALDLDTGLDTGAAPDDLADAGAQVAATHGGDHPTCDCSRDGDVDIWDFFVVSDDCACSNADICDIDCNPDCAC